MVKWSSAGTNPYRGSNKKDVLQGALEFRYFITPNKQSDKNFIPIMFSRKKRGRILDSFRFGTAVEQWN
jgi:hypothetical protein